jgi:hypothetical protein
MANVLNTDKKIAVIGALAEGSSIRSIERITGVHRDTIMRLGVKVGLHFAYYNFVKRHNTLRCTPAMAAGVESGFWSVGDLVEATA